MKTYWPELRDIDIEPRGEWKRGDDPGVCPWCASQNGAILNWIGSDMKPTGEYNYLCLDCRNEWGRCGDDC